MSSIEQKEKFGSICGHPHQKARDWGLTYCWDCDMDYIDESRIGYCPETGRKLEEEEEFPSEEFPDVVCVEQDEDDENAWKKSLTEEEKVRWSHYDDICGVGGCEDIVGRHCLDVGTIGYPICYSCDVNGEDIDEEEEEEVEKKECMCFEEEDISEMTDKEYIFYLERKGEKLEFEVIHGEEEEVCSCPAKGFRFEEEKRKYSVNPLCSSCWGDCGGGCDCAYKMSEPMFEKHKINCLGNVVKHIN